MADAPVVDPPEPPDLAGEIDDLDQLDDFDDLDDLAPVPVVTEDQVRRLLAGAGSALGWAIGDPDVPGHWRPTDDELADLAPPLTAMANRRPELARAIERSDTLTLALAMARYMGRNLHDGREARKARGDDGRNGEAEPAGGWGFAVAGGPAAAG